MSMAIFNSFLYISQILPEAKSTFGEAPNY